MKEKEKHPQNVIAMHARKGLYPSHSEKHGSQYKTYFISKTNSLFPNFDTSGAWQMGHNSQEGFFVGQKLLLDSAARIDLSSKVDNTITICQLPSKFQNTF